MKKLAANKNDVLAAYYRLELFIHKAQNRIEKAGTYAPDKTIQNDIELLSQFVKEQKDIISIARSALTYGKKINYKDYLDTPIRETPLSVRLSNSLKTVGIISVRELIAFKEKYGIAEFENFRNFGSVSSRELMNFIEVVETLN